MMHLAYIEKTLNPDTCNKYTTVCHYRIPPMRCCQAQPLGKCRVSLFPSCDDITMKDNPAPLFPCSPFIPFWKCNLRNVVILCWDVMMVGDRQPVVSLVFPSAPPKKKRGKKKTFAWWVWIVLWSDCTSAVLCCGVIPLPWTQNWGHHH